MLMVNNNLLDFMVNNFVFAKPKYSLFYCLIYFRFIILNKILVLRLCVTKTATRRYTEKKRYTESLHFLCESLKLCVTLCNKNNNTEIHGETETHGEFAFPL